MWVDQRDLSWVVHQPIRSRSQWDITLLITDGITLFKVATLPADVAPAVAASAKYAFVFSKVDSITAFLFPVKPSNNALFVSCQQFLLVLDICFFSFLYTRQSFNVNYITVGLTCVYNVCFFVACYFCAFFQCLFFRGTYRLIQRHVLLGLLS